MNSIEEFFRNRISFTYHEYMGDVILNRDFSVFDALYYEGKIYKPLRLNIKNTFDLVENLTPLLTYIASTLKEFKNNARKNYKNYQDYSFCIKMKLCRKYSNLIQIGQVFKVNFIFVSSLNINVIKTSIKRKIEDEHLVICLTPNSLTSVFIPSFYALLMKLK